MFCGVWCGRAGEERVGEEARAQRGKKKKQNQSVRGEGRPHARAWARGEGRDKGSALSAKT